MTWVAVKKVGGAWLVQKAVPIVRKCLGIMLVFRIDEPGHCVYGNVQTLAIGRPHDTSSPLLM